MKPSFALILSSDGITLLHRAIRGWLVVGEVSLEDPKLGTQLAYLRRTALALDPRGLATKLVLPEDQILYTHVSAPGRSEAQRRAQVAAALEGRTPYPVEELAFDITGEGPEFQVAVVARETLAEAEGFAAEHGFNPVSFVARPEGDGFPGEPFFGETRLSRRNLPEGTQVERDDEALAIVGRAVPPRDVPPRATAPETPEPGASVPSEAEAEAEAEAEVEAAAVEAAPEEAEENAKPEAPEAPAPEPEAEITPALSPTETEPPQDDVSAGDAARSADTAIEETVSNEAPKAAAAAAPTAPAAATPVPAGPATSPATGDTAAPPVADDTPDSPLETAGKIPTAGTAESDGKAAATMDVAAGTQSEPPAQGASPAFASRRSATRQDPASPTSSAGASGTAPPPQAPNPTTDEARGKPPTRRRPAKSEAPAQQRRATQRRIPQLPAGIAVPAASATDPAPAPAGAPDAAAATLLRPSPAAPPAPRSAEEQAQIQAEAFAAFAAQRTPVRRRSSGRMARIVLPLALAAVVGIAAVVSVFVLDRKETATSPVRTAAQTSAPSGTEPTAPLPNKAAPQETAQKASTPEQPPPAVPDATPSPEAPDTASQGGTDAKTRAEATPPVATPAATPAPMPSAPQDQSAPEQVASAEPAAEQPAASGGLSLPADPQTRLVPAGSRQRRAPSAAQPPATTTRGAIKLPAPGGTATAGAAGAPASPTAPASDDSTPRSPVNPPAYGTHFDLGPDGLVVPTKQGAVTPDGAVVYAGRPPVVPPPRPGTAPATQDATSATQAGSGASADTTPATPAAAPPQPAATAKPTQADATPKTRPGDLGLPSYLVPEASAHDPDASKLAVALSPVPQGRPANFASISAAALAAAEAAQKDAQAAAAAAAPAQPPASTDEQDTEPEPVSVAPNLPTSASVAKRATVHNALKLNQLSLIGVFGSSSNRQALLRTAAGKIVKVKVGDQIEGGRVSAISENQLYYSKNGRNVVLSMPKG